MVCTVLRIAGAYKITFCRSRLDHFLKTMPEQGVHPGQGQPEQRRDAGLRDALHHWFDAQVRDHGSHATR